MSLQVQDVLNALQQMQKSLECSICLELLKDPHSTKCNHQFCGQCIRKVLEKSSKTSKNKWYCPLCKTLVSKRSLTPNPKLSEIVAAVRNLQVAIQDDTGIPTGSPPLQQSKTYLIDANTSLRGQSSSHLLSTSKEVTADEDVQGQQPHSVSKANIRSCLRASTMGHKKAQVVKPKKPTGTNTKCTRDPRHSKRISQKNGEVEDSSEKSMNVDLLHMIDTMSFQPASNTDATDSSKDFILVPSTHESKQSDESMSTHDLSRSTKKEAEMGEQNSRCENIICSVEELSETTRCLTTIAEADSSSICRINCDAKIAPNNSTVLCDVTSTGNQVNEVAVSSTKFESSPQSTVDTIQSLSILPPIGCLDICDANKDADVEKNEEISDEGEEGNLVQQTCSAVDGLRSESQDESHQNQENITCEEMKGNTRITTEVCTLDNQDKPCMEMSTKAAVDDQEDDYGRNAGKIDGMNTVMATEQERKTEQRFGEDGFVRDQSESSKDEPNDVACQNDGESDSNPAKAFTSECQKEPIHIDSKGCKSQLSLGREVADSRVPSEVFEKGVSDLTEQSLDFEGLVSLFDDPSERRKETQRGEVENMKSCEDIFEGDGQSSQMKEYCQADLQHMENRDASALHGRAHLKKRKREIELEDDPGSRSRSGPEPAGKETSPSKQSAYFVSEFNTPHESKLPTFQVGARKKLKVSNRSSFIKTSPIVEGIKQNSQDPREGFIASDGAEAEMGFNGDELEVNSFFFSQKEFPNEIVPNSASTSNTPTSPLINPMIVYVDHTLHDLQTSVKKRKEVCSSQEKVNSGHEERTKTVNHMRETRGDVQVQSQEQTSKDREPWINFTACGNSNPDWQESMLVETSRGNVPRCLIDEGEEGEGKKDDLADESKDASSGASESILRTRKRKYETIEGVKMEYHHRIDDTQALKHELCFSRKQKATTHSPEDDICHLDESCLGNVVESVVKTSCELLTKGALSTVSTPTQSSLDSLEEHTVTPCLFGNDSCEAAQETKSNRDQNREMSKLNSISENQDNKPNISRKVDPVENVTDEESSYADEASIKTGLEGMKMGGKCRPTEVRSPFSRVNTPTNDNPDNEGTQSFGTFQSVSILQDVVVLSQEQQECTGICDDALVHQTSHVQDGNNAASSCAEPLPKRESALHPLPQEVDMNGSYGGKKGRGKARASFSQLTDSEVIPPTPPIRATARLNFASDAPSIVKESRSVKVATKGNGKKQHEYPITSKKMKRIQNRDCCKSPRSVDQGNRVSAMEETTSVSSLTENFSLANEANANVSSDSSDQDSESDNDTFPARKRRSSSQDKFAAKIRPDCTMLSKSSKDKARHLESPSRSRAVEEIPGNKAGNSPQNRINGKKARDESQVVVCSKKRTQKDLRRKSSPEESNANYFPCSALLEKTFDHEDTFDSSGTQSKVKRQGNFQADRSCISPILDDTKDHHYLTEGKDNRFEDLSKAKHEYQDLDDEFVKRADSSKENERGCVDEDCLSVDERSVTFNEDDVREESSDDEALLKPAFLSKESKSATNDDDCQEDMEDIEEDEEPILSQELLLSENDDGVISSPCKAFDSTCASSATFLSEAAASTQKMEVLRQDVEAMEREMEELRAYLSNADENRETGTDVGIEGVGSGDEVDDNCDSPDKQLSLTPPPPLTPKSIPPMRQLATPLKEASRYLDQEGLSSDEENECPNDTVNDPDTGSQSPTCSSFDKTELIVEKRHDSPVKPPKKRPFSPSFETDGESVKAVERRLVETPSPPSSKGAAEILNDADKLIAFEDRDSDSRAGSLLLVKKRKLTSDFVPKKSPVVSLLFRKSRKNPEKPSAMPKPETQAGGSSPVVKRSSSFLYSRKRGSCISPISRAQPTPRTESANDALLDTMSRSRGNSQKEEIMKTGENTSFSDESPKSGPSKDVLSESLSGEHRLSPDLVLTVAKDITNSTVATDERERRNSSGFERTVQLSFVATRLNRQQLADARALAEAFGGKLASEFNSKTSHVIMATDENMQVTRHSYTMKYLLGLSLGKWIVSHHWISACKQAKTLVSEANYEVKGDSGLGQNSIPRKARKARAKKETLLFHEFDVLCFGGFGAAVRRGQLCQLLKFCGARVFVDAENLKTADAGRRRVVVIDKETRENVDEIKVLCRQLKTKAVSLEWATDSIANYKVQDLTDYVVKL